LESRGGRSHVVKGQIGLSSVTSERLAVRRKLSLVASLLDHYLVHRGAKLVGNGPGLDAEGRAVKNYRFGIRGERRFERVRGINGEFRPERLARKQKDCRLVLCEQVFAIGAETHVLKIGLQWRIKDGFHENAAEPLFMTKTGIGNHGGLPLPEFVRAGGFNGG